MWAAEGGHEGMVNLLLDRKEVNPDSKDPDGKTPLLYAAKGGHEGIVKLLLDRKEVNPDSKEIGDTTPLLWAARGGCEQCSQRGSPSVLELDGGGRRSAVPSGLFQKLPCAPRPKTVSPAVPGSPPRNEMTCPATLCEGL